MANEHLDVSESTEAVRKGDVQEPMRGGLEARLSFLAV